MSESPTVAVYGVEMDDLDVEIEVIDARAGLRFASGQLPRSRGGRGVSAKEIISAQRPGTPS